MSEESARRDLADKLGEVYMDMDCVLATPKGGMSGGFMLDLERAMRKVDDAKRLIDPEYERHAKGPNHALPCRYCGGGGA